MLKKLFKYEWKATSKSLIVVHAIVLIFAVLTKILFVVSGGLEQESDIAGKSVIAGLFLFLSIIVIATAAIFTVIFIGFRFYKNVFTDQGYLTNTLPVTPQQIIISKGLVGLIWEVLDIIIVIAAFFIIAADGEMLRELTSVVKESIKYLFNGETALSAWLVLITVVLSPVVYILEMYVSVALGNLFSGHKLLGAVGAFAGIYTVQQIVMIITLGITGYKAFSVTVVYPENVTEAQVQMHALKMVDTTMLVNLILSLIAIIASFLVTKYIMTKKLNLQ